MSLRLRLLSAWAPGAVLRRMLGRVDELTTGALDLLVEKHAPAARATMGKPDPGSGKGLEQRRAAMAAAHNARVTALVDALGRGRAVTIGREALFQAGLRLGQQARSKFGVGDDRGDLVRAAGLLYRVLGIHFELEEQGDGSMLMRVDRCALSHHYSEEACIILSAADEGVVCGLTPRFKMRFEQRMTGGPAVCLASIREDGK